MRFALKSTLPAAFLFALLSSYGGSSEDNIIPFKIKHVLERDGTRVFKWDPPGAEPVHTLVVDFYLKPSAQFQKLDVDLRPGDVAYVMTTGCWGFSENGKYHWSDCGGNGYPAELGFIEPGAQQCSLLMDAHLNKYSDRYIFTGARIPVEVHGPCTSLTFVTNEAIGDRSKDSKDDFKGSGSLGGDQKGRLHVHIEMPDHSGENGGFSKEK